MLLLSQNRVRLREFLSFAIIASWIHATCMRLSQFSNVQTFFFAEMMRILPHLMLLSNILKRFLKFAQVWNLIDFSYVTLTIVSKGLMLSLIKMQKVIGKALIICALLITCYLSYSLKRPKKAWISQCGSAQLEIIQIYVKRLCFQRKSQIKFAQKRAKTLIHGICKILIKQQHGGKFSLKT